MDKKKLKDEIKEITSQIKANSKDAKFAERLVKELLSKKGQVDVEATLVHVPVTGKEETIDTGGAYKIYRNSHALVFHSNGFDFVHRKDGYDVVIKNFLKAAHCPYDKLFELWNKRNEGTLEGEDKDMYDVLLLCAVTMMQALNISSTSEQRQAELFMLVNQWLEELNEEMENQEVPVEDSDLNNGDEVEVEQENEFTE